MTDRNIVGKEGFEGDIFGRYELDTRNERAKAFAKQ